MSGASLPIVHMSVIEPAPATIELPVKFSTVKCPASTSAVNVQPFVWESETVEFVELTVEVLQGVLPVTVTDVAFPAAAIAMSTPCAHAIFAFAPT